VKFPACDGSGPHREPAAFPGPQLSRQPTSLPARAYCLPGLTQVGTDGDQFGICDGHQAGQVSRRELEEAVALTWKEEPGSGNEAARKITASHTG